MGKTLTRLVTEISIAIGVMSILFGIVMILVNSANLYTPRFLGLSPEDFLEFGGVCFLFAIAFTGRRILKFMEYTQRHERNNHL